MKRPDLDDLITQKTAAELRGISAQGISSLVKRGRLRVYMVDGKPFLSRREVLAYKPSKGGRPRKKNAKKRSRRR